MNRHQLIAGLFCAALIILVASMSGLVDAAALAQATSTRRPTRDRTTNPRRTKTPETATAPSATPEATAEPIPQTDDSASALMTSQLLVFNTGSRKKAQVNFTLFDAQGDIAYETAFRIKKNGAKIVSVPESLGDGFLGSARIVAKGRVQALVLENNGGTASDAYEVTNVTSPTLTLPYLRHGTTALDSTAHNSIIAIQNVTAFSTEATLTAFDEQGGIALTHPVTVPPRAAVFLNTNDLFGATNFLGSARITASQRLAAVELASSNRDTASLRALTEQNEGARLIVPIVEHKRAKGGLVAWSQIYVRNNGDAPSDITLKFMTANGKAKHSVTRSNIPAGGLAIFDLSTAEFQTLGKKYAGWGDVSSSADTPLMAHAFVTRGRGKQWVGVGALARQGVNEKNVCGDLRVTAKQNSVLTLLNPRAKQKALVRLRLYNHDDGALVADVQREIAPNSQLIITSKNGLPANFQGIAVMSADKQFSRSVVATVLTQTRKNKNESSTRGYVCP